MSESRFAPLEDYREFPEPEMRDRARAFYAEIRGRRTVRAFSQRLVPRDIIETCLLTAGSAPSGANRQPWHFVAIGHGPLRRRIRDAAEAEERAFYDSKAGAAWLRALEPLGTDADKPFLEIAPWLIAVFGLRYDVAPDGARLHNYYVPESVGIAVGFLLAALRLAGLASLTHTPSPMGFLNDLVSASGA